MTVRVQKRFSRVVFLFIFSSIFLAFPIQALGLTDDSTPSQDCPAMQYRDITMGMCMPQPMAGMSMSMLMLQANGFLTSITEIGPRGRNAIAFPDMFMLDGGHTLGDNNYLNLELMGTIERWTFPDQGYPELLQIGEENNQGVPYLDAQHPHSSPIMGLTLSDTYSFGKEKDHLKIYAGPRGEATEGPIAFMHRATGVVNPDAPLGHHIGQDVGHIVSTVIGESLKIGRTNFEFSTYHGAEPLPQNTNLPLGNLDSYSFRVIEELTPEMTMMTSYAYISNPELDSPDITFENRYSASLFTHFGMGSGWTYDNTLIWGAVSNLDHASTLTSFAEEFLFKGEFPRIWGAHRSSTTNAK